MGYTMTVPLLVPEKRWMNQIMLHSLTRTDVNWWHLRAASGGSLPRASNLTSPLPFDPWIGKGSGLKEVAYWYELTDFVQFPYITTFGSVPGMLEALRTLDVTTIRNGMRRFNKVS